MILLPYILWNYNQQPWANSLDLSVITQISIWDIKDLTRQERKFNPAAFNNSNKKRKRRHAVQMQLSYTSTDSFQLRRILCSIFHRRGRSLMQVSTMHSDYKYETVSRVGGPAGHSLWSQEADGSPVILLSCLLLLCKLQETMQQPHICNHKCKACAQCEVQQYENAVFNNTAIWASTQNTDGQQIKGKPE